MKYFAIFAVLLCMAAAVHSNDNMQLGSSYGGAAPAPAAAGGYGGSSIPAPPCPKNYLFSCQPSLQPAPCAQPAGGYGSAGSYSENYLSYAVPQYIQGY